MPVRMDRPAPSQEMREAFGSSPDGTTRGLEPLVTAAFADSQATLDDEVAMIDRLFGGDIAALFK